MSIIIFGIKKIRFRFSLANTALITSLLFLTGCQEAYMPEDIDASKKLLVIEGNITDNPGPYIVSLSYSSPFSDRYYYDFIRDAAVYISDDEGNTEKLIEKGSGKYYTSKNGIQGTVGRKYKLRIELSDGNVFESIPAKMNPLPVFDSIYPVITVRDAINTNGDGEISISKESGVEVRFAATSPEMSFYRFSSSVTTQTTHTKTPMGAEGFDVYCWDNTALNNSIDVKSTVLSGSGFVIKEHNMGFLRYVFDASMPKIQNGFTIGPDVQVGWDVITCIYSMSPEAYTYYESVVKQLGAGGRIFDPIPSQLIGNIRCLTDSSKVALGLFDVTSDTVVFNAYYWTPALKVCQRKTDDTIPKILGSNCREIVAPPFWVYFY